MRRLSIGATTASLGAVLMVADTHEYLSTACWHGDHDYCNSMTGYGGEKRPGRCKFCDAHCRCECHNPRPAQP